MQFISPMKSRLLFYTLHVYFTAVRWNNANFWVCIRGASIKRIHIHTQRWGLLSFIMESKPWRRIRGSDYPSFPSEWLREIIEGVEGVFIRKRKDACARAYLCFKGTCARVQVGGWDPGILWNVEGCVLVSGSVVCLFLNFISLYLTVFLSYS